MFQQKPISNNNNPHLKKYIILMAVLALLSIYSLLSHSNLFSSFFSLNTEVDDDDEHDGVSTTTHSSASSMKERFTKENNDEDDDDDFDDNNDVNYINNNNNQTTRVSVFSSTTATKTTFLKRSPYEKITANISWKGVIEEDDIVVVNNNNDDDGDNKRDDDDDIRKNNKEEQEQQGEEENGLFEWPKWKAKTCHRWSGMSCAVLKERLFGPLPGLEPIDSSRVMRSLRMCCVHTLTGFWESPIDIERFNKKYRHLHAISHTKTKKKNRKIKVSEQEMNFKYSSSSLKNSERDNNNNININKEEKLEDIFKDHFVKYSFPSDFDSSSSSTTENNNKNNNNKNNEYKNLTATREAFLQAIGKLPRIRANVTYLSPLLPGQKNIRKRMKYEKLQHEQSFVSIFIPGNSYTRAIILSIAASMRGMHRHIDRSTHTCFRYTVTTLGDYFHVEKMPRSWEPTSVLFPIELHNKEEKVIFDVIWEYVSTFKALDLSSQPKAKTSSSSSWEKNSSFIAKSSSLSSKATTSSPPPPLDTTNASSSSYPNKKTSKIRKNPNASPNLPDIPSLLRYTVAQDRRGKLLCSFSAIMMRPMFTWDASSLFERFSRQVLMTRYYELFSLLSNCVIPGGVFALMMTPTPQFRADASKSLKWEKLAMNALLNLVAMTKQHNKNNNIVNVNPRLLSFLSNASSVYPTLSCGKMKRRKCIEEILTPPSSSLLLTGRNNSFLPYRVSRTLIVPAPRHMVRVDRNIHTQCIVRMPPPEEPKYVYAYRDLESCADVASREAIYHFSQGCLMDFP